MAAPDQSAYRDNRKSSNKATVERQAKDDSCVETAVSKEATHTDSSSVRKVRFYPRVNFRRIYVHNQEDRWYSPIEIRNNRKRDRQLQTLMSLRSEKLEGEETEPLQVFGLKSATERLQGLRLAKEAKLCVLREQACQEDQFRFSNNTSDTTFCLNHEVIAKFYSIYSKKAEFRATITGMEVSWHVEDLMAESGNGNGNHKKEENSILPSRLSFSPVSTKRTSSEGLDLSRTRAPGRVLVPSPENANMHRIQPLTAEAC
eukprot:scaffold3716_cov69-Cylindrotheca_fusiformis.AAC.3